MEKKIYLSNQQLRDLETIREHYIQCNKRADMSIDKEEAYRSMSTAQLVGFVILTELDRTF